MLILSCSLDCNVSKSLTSKELMNSEYVIIPALSFDIKISLSVTVFLVQPSSIRRIKASVSFNVNENSTVYSLGCLNI